MITLKSNSPGLKYSWLVFVLKFMLFDTSIVTPAFFLFSCNTLFHTLMFSLWFFLDLIWVSWRHCVSGFFFLIYLATLCLLIGAFSHSGLKLLMVCTYCHLFILFWLFCNSFVFLLFFSLSSLVIWWLSLVLCLDSFLFFVFVL